MKQARRKSPIFSPLPIKYVTQFDVFRKKRNIGGYERAGMVSDHEADEMLSLAKNIRRKVEDCLNENYPELLIED